VARWIGLRWLGGVTSSSRKNKHRVQFPMLVIVMVVMVMVMMVMVVEMTIDKKGVDGMPAVGEICFICNSILHMVRFT